MGVTETVLIFLVEGSDGPSNLALRKKRVFISAFFLLPSLELFRCL